VLMLLLMAGWYMLFDLKSFLGRVVDWRQ
jgi:hypothetical protein